jgi:hypothetical protein
VHIDSLTHKESATLDDTIDVFLESPWLSTILLITLALLFGLMPIRDVSQIKGRPWAEFYGDRLSQALKAGKGIDVTPQHESGQLSCITARELLGLPAHFTKTELRRAWLRLARQLHPDRWSAAGDGVRRMKEAAVKRFNAARDELMAQAL